MINFFKKNKFVIIFAIILIAHIFLQFYKFESINPFGWDQVDNAWAAKNILVDHKLPLVGMVAKQNSGFYIGPAYYYLVALFYLFTHLDPVASGILAGLTSIFTFFTVWHITKKLFSERIALWAVFIYTASYYLIMQGRIQWPVGFIFPISYIIFYCLVKILMGENKFLIFLFLTLGISLHIHFTSIFYFLIVICCAPFFKYNKSFFKNLLISIPIFFLFLIPNIMNEINSKASASHNLSLYAKQNYHGFHLVRFFQLLQDVFIEFQSVLFFPALKVLKFILPPLFLTVYYKKNKNRDGIIFCYLVVLWLLIPWIVFTTYSGTFSDYYFSSTLPIVIIVLAYVTNLLFNSKAIYVKVVIGLFWGYFAYVNLITFFHYDESNSLKAHRLNTQKKIDQGQVIEFQEGIPESYLFYLSSRNGKIK